VSIPSRIMEQKNMNIHRLGHGNNAKALGKILKLNSGPESFKEGSSICIPTSLQKWPR
jgi:hypothetical protein